MRPKIITPLFTDDIWFKIFWDGAFENRFRLGNIHHLRALRGLAGKFLFTTGTFKVFLYNNLLRLVLTFVKSCKFGCLKGIPCDGQPFILIDSKVFEICPYESTVFEYYKITGRLDEEVVNLFYNITSELSLKATGTSHIYHVLLGLLLGGLDSSSITMIRLFFLVGLYDTPFQLDDLSSLSFINIYTGFILKYVLITLGHLCLAFVNELDELTLS